MAKVAANLANLRPMLARLTTLGLLLLLTACAAAMPGYSPPSFKEKDKEKSKLTQPHEGGTMREGRYEMSADEKSLDCKRLTGSMQIAIARLRDANGREGPSGLSNSMQAVWPSSIMSKKASPGGGDRETDNARERAKLDAYNRQLAAKNCKTVDINAELARPPDGAKRY